MKFLKHRIWLGFLFSILISNQTYSGLSTEEKNSSSIVVFNKGIPGNNSEQGLQRFQKDVLDCKPNHLVLYFGINDALNTKKILPVDQFVENMQSMINLALTNGVQTVVLVTPNLVIDKYIAMRHPNHPGNFQECLNDYDTAIRKLATKNNLLLADLRKLCENHVPVDSITSLVRNETNSNSIDGTHLTKKGYEQLAQTISSLLYDRVKPGEKIVCLGDSITFGVRMNGAGTATGETYPAVMATLLNSSLHKTKSE